MKSYHNDTPQCDDGAAFIPSLLTELQQLEHTLNVSLPLPAVAVDEKQGLLDTQ